MQLIFAPIVVCSNLLWALLYAWQLIVCQGDLARLAGHSSCVRLVGHSLAPPLRLRCYLQAVLRTCGYYVRPCVFTALPWYKTGLQAIVRQSSFLFIVLSRPFLRQDVILGVFHTFGDTWDSLSWDSLYTPDSALSR